LYDLTLHVMPLRIDPANATLVDRLASIRNGRSLRARKMARASPPPHPGAYERHAIRDELRTSCRRSISPLLVEAGPRRHEDVFDRSVPAARHVAHEWATLTEPSTDHTGRRTSRHRASRGIADAEGMRALLSDFTAAGGDGIEILSRRTRPQKPRSSRRLARAGTFSVLRWNWHGLAKWMAWRSAHLPAASVPVWKDW